jgi:hypothetical protein
VPGAHVDDVLDHAREDRPAPPGHRVQVAGHVPHQRPGPFGGRIRQRVAEQVGLAVEVPFHAAGADHFGHSGEAQNRSPAGSRDTSVSRMSPW